jgi:hypothetical protein
MQLLRHKKLEIVGWWFGKLEMNTINANKTHKNHLLQQINEAAKQVKIMNLLFLHEHKFPTLGETGKLTHVHCYWNFHVY